MRKCKMDLFKETIEGLSYDHLNFLKDLDFFPQECVVSSHLLGAYLSKDYPELKIVYGTYGAQNFFHSWVEYCDEIFDFTLFQFIAYKEPKKFYRSLNTEELISYIKKYQQSFIIEKDSEYYSNYVPMFNPAVLSSKANNDYKASLKPLMEDIEGALNGWIDSKNEDNESFGEVLEAINKRIGKKYFTKWVIVNK